MNTIERLTPIATSDRPEIMGVRLAQIGNVSWAVATDGHVLVAVRADDVPGLQSIDLPNPVMLAKWMASLGDGEMVTNMSAIRAWTAKAGPLEIPCPTCGGDPSSIRVSCGECHGSGEHECSCGDTHECRDCDGRGTIKMCRACKDGTVRAKLVIGRILGCKGPTSSLDLNIVAKGLAALADTPDDATVRVRWMSNVVHFLPDSGSWFMAVAPRQDGSDDADVAVLG